MGDKRLGQFMLLNCEKASLKLTFNLFYLVTTATLLRAIKREN